MNYIIQLNNSFKLFTDDDRITPYHISLYMALFHKWNNAKFRNPLSIARDDLMFLSKIGSANTYIKCLKELHNWGYIKYMPSHSYHVGSKIHMFVFNKTTKQTTNKTKANGTDILTDNKCDKTKKQDLRPYKNIKKKLNIINNNKQLKDKKEAPSSTNQLQSNTIWSKPELEEVKTYFIENNSTKSEAEKFFNYFESNGWLVGGKTSMRNWKAACNNWILNSRKFSISSQKQNTSNLKSGNLNATINKNYGEPL